MAQAEDQDQSVSRREEDPLVSARRATLGPAWKYFIDSIHEVLPRAGSAWLLRLGSPFRVSWEVAVVLLAVWNCFYVPFMVAFWPEMRSEALHSLDILIDVVYIADIVVYSRSTYIDMLTGEEVLKASQIFKHYFYSGKFAIDLISALPVDVISWQLQDYEELQLLTVFKIARVLRIGKVLMFLRTNKSVKLKIKVAQLMFLFITYVHIVGCLWYLCIRLREVYIPPALYVDKEAELYAKGMWEQYAYSLYMSVYMLTAAEIGPRSENERIFAGCAVLSGQLFQAFMFGELAVVLFNLNQRSAKITVIQNAAITTMGNMRLDHDLQRNIINYLIDGQGSLLKQQESEEFFALLPPSLLQEVRSVLFQNVILRKSSVRKHPSAAQSILFRLGNLSSQPEQTVIQQGEQASAMYFIISGKCEVWVLNADRDSHKVRILTPGGHFGEVALLYPVLRTATVVTCNYTNFAVLSAEDFQYICEKYPSTRQHFRNSALKYSDEWTHFVTAVLKKCPFLRSVSLPILRELIYYLPITAIEPNSYLYKSGEKAEKITFLLSGKVVVYVPITDFRLTATQFYKSRVKLQRFPTQAVQLFLSAFGRKNDRFIVKFEMDYLERGSVICQNLTLLGETSYMFVKTVDTCTIATLSVSLLASITANIPEIRSAVNAYKSLLRTNTEMRPGGKYHMGATDYDKSFALDLGLEKGRRLWHGKMTLRKCAIGKLLERRENRRIGFSELPNLSHKLRAFLEAEKREDQKMAEKIRKSVLTVDFQRLISTLELLDLPEVENAILAQFALQASNYSAQIISILERIRGEREAVIRLEKTCFKTKIKGNEVMKMLKLAVLLRENLARAEGKASVYRRDV